MIYKPKTFYFAGQWSFGNRGCEALIRSNTMLIREQLPDARLYCPSRDIELDRKQWPTAGEHGVEFVPAPIFPFGLKLWGKAYGGAPAIRRLGPPRLLLDPATRRLLQTSDALLMTGGDIISLDYGLISLFYWVGLVEAARRLGKPTHLVAASVGPFSKDPVVERQMVRHLAGYTSITVRETASADYLASLGINGVKLVTDPAFVMLPEPWPLGDVTQPERSIVGLNVSPIARGFRQDEASRQAFDEEIKAFVRELIDSSAYQILLIPHVDPLRGTDGNSDRAYMARLLLELDDKSGRVSLLPDGLNAAQLKYTLGLCRYFIGARTHATIGALSQTVPTVSIAYSVKAIGINKDLFGSTRYVLPTPDVTAGTLADALAQLEIEETQIRNHLANRMPDWRATARKGVSALGL